MSQERKNFDQVAGLWDEKPQRVQLAQDVAQAIVHQVALDSQMNVLDFGCGTGLLTLALQPHVRTVIGADSSKGMLEVLNTKLAAASVDNVCSMLCNLEEGDSLQGHYDVVVSSMTLHHVEHIDALLTAFKDVMTPNARLCLADLDAEGGRFHGDNTGVFHFGFDRDQLANQVKQAGFSNVSVTTAAEIIKGPPGQAEQFTVFLLTAQNSK